MKGKLFLSLSAGACVLLAAGVLTRETKVGAEAFAGNYADWALTHFKENGQSQLSIFLPSVYVYDASGKAVYFGHSLKNDGPVLESLPKSGMPAISHSPSLPELLEMAPDMKKDSGSIVSSGRQTVVSITSNASSCPRCALQDALVAKLKQRAAQANVNVVEIRLQ